MNEYENGSAGDREHSQRNGEPDRQRGGRDQNRRQKQEGERILQAAGQEQQPGQFDDVQRQQRGRKRRLEPLHRIEPELKDQIQKRGKADDGEARHDLDIEFKTLLDDEDSRELPKRGEPAQPQNRVQTDLAARETKIG